MTTLADLRDLTEVAIRPARLQPMVHETFGVWHCTGSGGLLPHDPHFVGEAHSFKAAVRLGEACGAHKSVFFIRKTDLRPARPVNTVDNSPGQVLLYFFTVKKSTKKFVYRPALDGDYPVREGQLYSEPLFTVRADRAFAECGKP